MEGFFILLAILGVTGAIALVTFIIYRTTHPKLKDDGKPTEEEILHEEIDRVLQPIEDDELRKEIEDYKEKDD